MKKSFLVCTTEYYPYGSGIANVAYNLVTEFKKEGIDCKVCSPTGPDIFLGNKTLISKYGRLGLLYYWYKVSTYFAKDREYEVVWLHQPLFLLKNPFIKSISTVHVTTLGHFKASYKLKYNIFLKIYYLLSSLIEIYSFKKLKATTLFITDSPKVSQELIGIVGNKVNPIYIPNGVNTCRFKPINDTKMLRNMFGIPESKKVFLTVGRLIYQKKLFLMIDIFSQILCYDDNCFLVIAGKGKLYSKLKDYISSNNIKNVYLIGFVSDVDLPSLYSCADFYIMTSEYEGQPLTLLEAMASGLPCIVSDIPNLRMIVEDARCGIIVDFLDKERAVFNIVEYIRKDNSIHGINARKYAENKLDWSVIAEKYLGEFHKLMM